MKRMTHKDCNLARGVKEFKCFKCGKHGNNYSNGVSICKSCSEQEGSCRICGKPLTPEKEEINNPNTVDKESKLIEICKQYARNEYRVKGCIVTDLELIEYEFGKDKEDSNEDRISRSLGRVYKSLGEHVELVKELNGEVEMSDIDLFNKLAENLHYNLRDLDVVKMNCNNDKITCKTVIYSVNPMGEKETAERYYNVKYKKDQQGNWIDLEVVNSWDKN